MSDESTVWDVVWDWAGIVIVSVLVVVGLALMMRTANDCADRGGTLVRGAVWLECVDAKGDN